MTATIAICLATYNGARFLDAQLDSIAAQTHEDWHLYARDDGSDDGTREILDDFAFAHPDRVTLIRDDLGRLGACANFARVMGIVDAPYIAFSDQDDVWHPTKLARSLNCLTRLEAAYPADTPAMIHADRRLINARGDEITPSYWGSRGLSPADFRAEESYFTFCLAAGSAMLINRALLARATPVPASARMYDCWIELTAQMLGVVDWMDEVVLDHRRHNANTTGAKSDSDSAAARRPLARAGRLMRNLGHQRRIVAGYLAQADAFQRLFAADLAPDAAWRLSRLVSLPSRLLPGRLMALWQSRANPPGVARSLVFAALAQKPPKDVSTERVDPVGPVSAVMPEKRAIKAA